ncbi:MAG: prepilin-type N-terminal cleavage/methylation domain, partial [Verrucomicrobiales bacterium]|nr:prepilin-type N-terminal cleavage/methylation domain [Verrucomicrobiales bacterium]
MHYLASEAGLYPDRITRCGRHHRNSGELASARDEPCEAIGQSALCRSNLRQQGIGLAMYVNDFRAYPLYTTGYPLETIKFWMQFLEPYVGNKWPEDYVPSADASKKPGKGVFACPSYSRIGGVYYHPELTKGSPGGNGAYAYNGSDFFGGWGTLGFGAGAGIQLRAVGENEVMNPSRMISIGDAAIDGRFAEPRFSGGPTESDLTGITAAPWFWHLSMAKFSASLHGADQSLNVQDKAMLQRHGGRWNQLFCDGHVENGNLEKFFDYRKDEVLKLWNRDNLPHREQLQ